MEDNQYKIKVLSREFLKQHIKEFISIAADIPLEAWKEENYLYELEGKWKYSVIVVNEKQSVIGFIIASDKIETIHIHKFAVHPQYRSKGIGLLLLNYFEKNIKTNSKRKLISLYVDSENKGAIRFYEKSGFQFAGEVNSMNYYKKQLKIIVAIHQPNFFPWLGYFNKIAECDKFIVLDHVKNKPSDGIYPKRVTIVCNGQPFWLTIPLIQPKDQLFLPINEMVISQKENFAPKHLRTIEMNYRKTPFYEEYFEFFLKFYEHSSNHIAQRNIDILNELVSVLNINTHIFQSSSFGFDSSSNELLIELVKAVDGDVYLHGSYAISEKGYQDNDLFHDKGIVTKLQNFTHPIYKQHNNKNEFILGASIMDALMNVGKDEVRKMIFQCPVAISDQLNFQ